VPARPLRDAALIYGALAVVIVVIAAATGASVGRAVVIAVLFFAVSVAWTLGRIKQRRRRDARAAEHDEQDERRT
jgi:Flp pilus assembly protein TadB